MELIIAAGIIAAAVLYSRSQSSTALPTPAPPMPMPAPTGPLISGAYTVPPLSIGNFGAVLSGAAATGASSPAIQIPTVLPWASPAVIGGIAGTAASGGNPYGGVIRPGLTLGTGTTVVIPGVKPVIS